VHHKPQLMAFIPSPYSSDEQLQYYQTRSGETLSPLISFATVDPRHSSPSRHHVSSDMVHGSDDAITPSEAGRDDGPSLRAAYLILVMPCATINARYVRVLRLNHMAASPLSSSSSLSISSWFVSDQPIRPQYVGGKAGYFSEVRYLGDRWLYTSVTQGLHQHLHIYDITTGHLVYQLPFALSSWSGRARARMIPSLACNRWLIVWNTIRDGFTADNPAICQIYIFDLLTRVASSPPISSSSTLSASTTSREGVEVGEGDKERSKEEKKWAAGTCPSRSFSIEVVGRIKNVLSIPGDELTTRDKELRLILWMTDVTIERISIPISILECETMHLNRNNNTNETINQATPLLASIAIATTKLASSMYTRKCLLREQHKWTRSGGDAIKYWLGNEPLLSPYPPSLLFCCPNYCYDDIPTNYEKNDPKLATTATAARANSRPYEVWSFHRLYEPRCEIRLPSSQWWTWIKNHEERHWSMPHSSTFVNQWYLTLTNTLVDVVESKRYHPAIINDARVWPHELSRMVWAYLSRHQPRLL
jgi:hypothetical protein